MKLLQTLTLLLAALANLHVAGAATSNSITNPVAVLRSSASLKEKTDACQELARSGGREAIPVLASMLADPEVSHIARYALEPMADPAVDRIFRQALTNLQGRPLVGVISSIALRGDPQAVPNLSPLLSSPNGEIADAAARALGAIGDKEALRLLLRALPKSGDLRGNAIGEGLLLCAEAMNPKEKTRIYREILEKSESPQILSGAMEGMVRFGGRTGEKLLYKSLGEADPVLFAAALKASPKAPGPEVTRGMLGISQRIGAERRVMVIQIVADRKDEASLPGLYSALQGGEKPVRVAAAKALGQVGQEAASVVLLTAARDPDPEIAKAAFESLASLPGFGVDRIASQLMVSRYPADRKLGLELAGRRRVLSSLPQVLELAREDMVLAPVAIRKVGELGGDKEIPLVTDMFLRARLDAEIEAAEAALSMLAARSQEPQQVTELVASRIVSAEPRKQAGLMQILAGLGTPGALQTLRDASRSENPETRSTAIRLLANASGLDAAPDLLEIARNSEGNDRAVALRGYLRHAGNSDIPEAQRLQMCREAAALVQSDQEKKLLVSALGSINAPEAVKLIEPWAEDPAVREEAKRALSRKR